MGAGEAESPWHCSGGVQCPAVPSSALHPLPVPDLTHGNLSGGNNAKPMLSLPMAIPFAPPHPPCPEGGEMGRKAPQGSTGAAQWHPEERGEVHGSLSGGNNTTAHVLLL